MFRMQNPFYHYSSSQTCLQQHIFSVNYLWLTSYYLRKFILEIHFIALSRRQFISFVGFILPIKRTNKSYYNILLINLTFDCNLKLYKCLGSNRHECLGQWKNCDIYMCSSLHEIWEIC